MLNCVSKVALNFLIICSLANKIAFFLSSLIPDMRPCVTSLAEGGVREGLVNIWAYCAHFLCEELMKLFQQLLVAPAALGLMAVSYTHLTLPTKRIV